MEDTSDLVAIVQPSLEPEVIRTVRKRSHTGRMPPLPPIEPERGEPWEPHQPRWGMVAGLMAIATAAWLLAMRELS